MRQRAFVILNPNQIARIDPAVAHLASEKMFGLMYATPIGALAEYRPAWSRFLDARDFHLISPYPRTHRSAEHYCSDRLRHDAVSSTVAEDGKGCK
jgi:hypothetical protein